MKTKKTEIIYIIHTLLQIVKKRKNQRAGWGLAKSINQLGSLWVSKMRVVSQCKKTSILNLSLNLEPKAKNENFEIVATDYVD